MTESVEAVRVHISGSDVPLTHQPPARMRRAASLTSFTLTSSDPVQQILPLNLNRCEAWVYNNSSKNVLLYTSLADAKAGGRGITLSAAATVPFPLHTTDPIWATAASADLSASPALSVWAIIEGA
jgi:hypothetical protein